MSFDFLFIYLMKPNSQLAKDLQRVDFQGADDRGNNFLSYSKYHVSSAEHIIRISHYKTYIYCHNLKHIMFYCKHFFLCVF